MLARPTAPLRARGGARRGRQALGSRSEPGGFLYVPRTYRDDSPAPLMVALHGAGGSARQRIFVTQAAMQLIADLTGIILLSPSSRGRTWDVIIGAYGSDVAFIDKTLGRVFSQYAVDPGRVAIGGFSDGASYALSLGLTNGDLFTHIIAFSPGFLVPAQPRGKPRIFIAHGTHDSVLPIERCSRRIVPRLNNAGYDVCYREFNGPHIIMPHLLLGAVRWLKHGRAI